MGLNVKRSIFSALFLLVFITDSASADEAETGRWTQGERETGYVVFRHHPLHALDPAHRPPRQWVTDAVSCVLAQREHESLQLGVHAVAGELKDVRLEVDCELAVKVYRQGTAPEHGYPPQVLLDQGDTVGKVDQDHSAGFWLTFYAPVDTRPRVYRGTITIKPTDRPAT